MCSSSIRRMITPIARRQRTSLIVDAAAAQLQNPSLTRHKKLLRSLAPVLIGISAPNSAVLMVTCSAGLT